MEVVVDYIDAHRLYDKYHTSRKIFNHHPFNPIDIELIF